MGNYNIKFIHNKPSLTVGTTTYGASNCSNGTFVMAFNLEGLHDSDDEFRSCMPLDGNTTTITFQTGLNTSSTTICDCFIMYEFDVVISQGVAVATNKYNDFSNDNLK